MTLPSTTLLAMVFIDQTAAVAQRIISLALVPAAAQQKRW